MKMQRIAVNGTVEELETSVLSTGRIEVRRGKVDSKRRKKQSFGASIPGDVKSKLIALAEQSRLEGYVLVDGYDIDVENGQRTAIQSVLKDDKSYAVLMARVASVNAKLDIHCRQLDESTVVCQVGEALVVFRKSFNGCLISSCVPLADTPIVIAWLLLVGIEKMTVFTGPFEVINPRKHMLNWHRTMQLPPEYWEMLVDAGLSDEPPTATLRREPTRFTMNF